MEHDSTLAAALTVSLALAAGMISQSVARHLRVPGIVLLLGVGVVLGPDVAGVVQPASIGPALHILVGFAVAVILFEGGMNLSLKRLRQQAGVIQRLITLGALVTAVGGTLIGRYIMDWDWRLAAPFGALVVVTGPTVITPLLRRIKVAHRVETVLEAEGVLIDAIGAVLAVVTLEVVISFSAQSLAGGMLGVLFRLGFGVLFGVLGGALIAVLLRFKKVVPDGFENVLTLSLVLALFQVSNSLLPESGIMTVTAAGMVVGNVRTRALRDLMEFKEQLTLMFIGLLFVLLAADVRVEHVVGLGWTGVAAVACLMFVVRPINIVVSTAGSDLTLREKTFLSWLAPRGVVAAAVASLFAQTLEHAGIPGGEDLRALVFMVIACTVVIQGLSGGQVARMLGLRRQVVRGYAIVGADKLGRVLARRLLDGGSQAILVDNNPVNVRAAEEEGFKVVYGSILEERTQLRAGMDELQGSIAVTPNDEFNLLFANMALDDYQHREIYIALRQTQISIHPELVEHSGAQVLFGRQRDLDLWRVRLRRGLAAVQSWELVEPPAPTPAEGEAGPYDFPEHLVLPLVLNRGNRIWPVSHERVPKKGDVVDFAVFLEKPDEVQELLSSQGWQPVEAAAEEEPAP